MLNTLNQALWELQNRRLEAYFKVMDSVEDLLEPFAKELYQDLKQVFEDGKSLGLTMNQDWILAYIQHLETFTRGVKRMVKGEY